MTSQHNGARQILCDFPDVRTAPDEEELLCISSLDAAGNQMEVRGGLDWPVLTEYGNSLAPEVLLTAYGRALFPMPLDVDDDISAIGWWSPSERAYFSPDAIKVSDSLSASMKKFTFTVDEAFSEVIAACADLSREHRWISPDVIEAYTHMHELGYAHSIEVWNADGELAGGLYGLEIGYLFAGESMFHRDRDASKAALVHLGSLLSDHRPRLIDAQWMTPHLASLGAKSMSRKAYVDIATRLVAGRNALGERKTNRPFMYP